MAVYTKLVANQIPEMGRPGICSTTEDSACLRRQKFSHLQHTQASPHAAGKRRPSDLTLTQDDSRWVPPRESRQRTEGCPSLLVRLATCNRPPFLLVLKPCLLSKDTLSTMAHITLRLRPPQYDKVLQAAQSLSTFCSVRFRSATPS